MRDSSGEIASYLEPPRAAWLAQAAGNIAGTIALRPLPVPGACEIKRLYVRPAARGGGVAGALLAALERFAREQGYREAYLDSRSDLHVALAFYRRRGYTDCDRYNDNSEATVFMRRSLLGTGG